jgi:hypothetical protein
VAETRRSRRVQAQNQQKRSLPSAFFVEAFRFCITARSPVISGSRPTQCGERAWPPANSYPQNYLRGAQSLEMLRTKRAKWTKPPGDWNEKSRRLWSTAAALPQVISDRRLKIRPARI